MKKELEKDTNISIHAPLRERLSGTFASCTFAYFNPRSLTGATIIDTKRLAAREFQSTLPYGSDVGYNLFRSPTLEFQSTLPYGSDRVDVHHATMRTKISIHAPLRERPQHLKQHRYPIYISIHAPLRERLHVNKIILHSKHFNPRSLTGATKI